MQLKLSQAIFNAYQDKGVELTVQQVETKLSDLIDYMIEGTIPDMVSEGIL